MTTQKENWLSSLSFCLRNSDARRVIWENPTYSEAIPDEINGTKMIIWEDIWGDRYATAYKGIGGYYKNVRECMNKRVSKNSGKN